MTTRERIIESLIYIKGDEGIKVEDIKDIFKLETIAVAKDLMNKFVEAFNSEKRGLIVEEYNGIYKFVTIPEAKEFISAHVSSEAKAKLSDAALEVVGIIAYKAPITRSSINAIRGKISDHIVNLLMLKGLVEEVGIAKTPGNPVLFGVTDKFYDYFRIRSLNELPRLSDFANIDLDTDTTEEIIDLYSSQREDQ
ncbi:MAG: SMC-Scp complex subunit ScpB [Mycoplasma sp.]|nr:SMC-Scp complex subunit ScpB [Mycoplasma sp.]